MGKNSAFFKNPFYERLPQKGSFAFGLRSPVPGQAISADRKYPEIEIMERVTVPSSRGRTDAAGAAGSSRAA